MIIGAVSGLRVPECRARSRAAQLAKGEVEYRREPVRVDARCYVCVLETTRRSLGQSIPVGTSLNT